MQNNLSNISSIKYFNTGHCTQKESLSIRGGKWKTIKFPSLVALIEHKEFGYILFDLGYGKKFNEITSAYPYKLYSKVTKVFLNEESLLHNQILQQNISPKDIKHIILSHFHADHMGGLEHFPNATIITSQQCYNFNIGKKGVRALANGFLPGLLPTDAISRLNFTEDRTRIKLSQDLHPFAWGWDLFNDGSIIAIELPGHAKGQIGIMINTANQVTFLVADACWSSQAYRENKRPHLLTFLFHHNKKDYLDTLHNIHKLHLHNPQVKIVPTHCNEMWQANER